MELLLTMMDKSGMKADCLREIKSSVLDIFKFKCKLVIQTERSSGPLDIQVWNRDSSVEEITINVHSNGWNGNLNKKEFPHRRPTPRSQENKEPPAERVGSEAEREPRGSDARTVSVEQREQISRWIQGRLGGGGNAGSFSRDYSARGGGGGRQRGGWRPYRVAL